MDSIRALIRQLPAFTEGHAFEHGCHHLAAVYKALILEIKEGFFREHMMANTPPPRLGYNEHQMFATPGDPRSRQGRSLSPLGPRLGLNNEVGRIRSVPRPPAGKEWMSLIRKAHCSIGPWRPKPDGISRAIRCRKFPRFRPT